jgi:hypothetical protein
VGEVELESGRCESQESWGSEFLTGRNGVQEMRVVLYVWIIF